VLRSKWSGLGAVLNPSASMIQIFRLGGRTFLYGDLIDEAIRSITATNPGVIEMIKNYLNISVDEYVNPETNRKFEELIFKIYII
jgi:hypothetical protein